MLQSPRHYAEQPRHLCAALAGAAQSDRGVGGAASFGIEDNKLSVVGLDCLDGTPLLDIKPYFASTDLRTRRAGGVACRARELSSFRGAPAFRLARANAPLPACGERVG